MKDVTCERRRYVSLAVELSSIIKLGNFFIGGSERQQHVRRVRSQKERCTVTERKVS